ncbi:hypothetical protein GE09DRAFT_558303 [Coniochaeta sp. 2T2.1]|nr:hypothetical protein GE09DRAFT_558303 [Coniochaeta sp. 2T2.1]
MMIPHIGAFQDIGTCHLDQSGWASIASPTPSTESAIQVRWQSSDLSLLETEPFDNVRWPPSTSPPTSTSPTVPAQTSSGRTGIDDGSATTPSTTTESAGSETVQSATLTTSAIFATSATATATVQPTARADLSTGAKAGIAVGAIRGIVFVASFLAWFWHRRRSQLHAMAITPEVPHLDGNPVSELEGKNHRPVSELPAKREGENRTKAPESDTSSGYRQADEVWI